MGNTVAIMNAVKQQEWHQNLQKDKTLIIGLSIAAAKQKRNKAVSQMRECKAFIQKLDKDIQQCIVELKMTPVTDSKSLSDLRENILIISVTTYWAHKRQTYSL